MGTRKYLAFDIETANQIPEGAADWRAGRPLGITCAAALASESSRPLLFYSKTDSGDPADRMTRSDAANMVRHLQAMVGDGHTLLTWNGLGFDLDILAEESGLQEACAALAMDHVDMMFHAFCTLGHPIALDRAAKAMGLPGKPEGMTGALAPGMWAAGQRQEVLDYVARDVRTTLEIAERCERSGVLRWITRSGSIRGLPLQGGLLTAREALELPEPDTSWMSRPMRRSRFTDWLSAPSKPSQPRLL
jgi:hypothetical protein